ncbi:MAG: MotA/TolQ/ExbB proton channel family protein [Gammaproteobacteria bacterium]|nr:MotA/TolQ/ExbB proton channel family protein [Gammaproteobacteria bacterium]
MDFATLVGLIAGILILTFAVALGSDFAIFVNIPGILIVVGGTGASVLIKFPLKICFSAFLDGLKTAFIDRSEQPAELIKLASQLSGRARREGKLVLEKIPVRNQFFRKGLVLVADGHPTEFIRKVMTLEMDRVIDRHMVSERVFRGIGESAPAFGMIGTLVGLVQMFVHLENPKEIGAGMAIAMLTTLYGAIIAYLVALPIADKLQMRAMAEHHTKMLIIEAIVNIARGENPKVIEEILLPYLPSSNRDSLEPDPSAPTRPQVARKKVL